MKKREKKTKKFITEYLQQKASGMAAVEGLLIFSALIFILFFFIGFGYFLYQDWLVNNVARDAANRIAQGYAYPETDPVTNYITDGMRSALSPYRYWGGNESTLENKNADRGEKYILWKLKKSTFAVQQGTPEIDIQTVSDSLGQRHVEVSIKAKYRVPAAGFLEYFGIPRDYEFQATGRAVCVDISNYIYSVDTLKQMTSDVAGAGTLTKTIDSLFQSIQKVAKLLR